MKLNNLLKAITIVLIVNTPWANQREEVQLQLQTKLQSLATETNDIEIKKLKLAITQLRDVLNRETMTTNIDNNSSIDPNSPIGSINPELQRDTYFYRGPVRNRSFGNPDISTSWEVRGYNGNAQFREGAPVFAINARNNHINEINGKQIKIHRNPFTNPDYKPNNEFYQNNRPNVNFQPNHWGNGFNFSFNNNFNNGFNQQWRPQFNQGPWNGYGNNQNFGPYQDNSIISQQRSREAASYDARERLMAELQADPRHVSNGRLNVVIESVSEIENGQLQVVTKIIGGVTGQNRNKQRVFIYTRQGSFVRQIQNPQSIINTGNQAIRVTRYDLSNNQKFSIDRYLTERGFNQYGDPRGTRYANGNPLSLISDGGAQSQENLRFNYILHNHQELVNLFQVTK
ncbi:MAG: hypothetical protein COB02_13580 [Candidatus Cloacimonadota bacterium]|nr:MAG: hypothetical protein COB02_13580 [Candidatus Cloacimonadota bacterium]